MLSSGIVLLHHNARPHTAAATKRLLMRFRQEVFDHPLSSARTYLPVIFMTDDGSNIRADIISINRNCHKAMILDPNVRFEINSQQAIQVDEEPCIPYFSVKYNIPVEKWSVICLLFGARGSLPKFTYTTLQHLGIHFSYINNKFLWEL